MENEHGWLNYYIMGNDAYLENMYIYPESRKSQHGTALLSAFELKLKEIHQVKFLITTISRIWGNADKTLGICLKRGFKFHFSDNLAIILKKEI